ncbi:MAG: isoprenylcysteine carboxylmethyltransferase family protein [Taibaiella sp.]|nr:isoprenylcysteine carboxylmethyltransferase family protein [Taibaiella sp.]
MDIRYFLLVYFILFFTCSFWGVSYRVARRIKKNPEVLPNDDSAFALVGRYFKRLMLALFLYVVFIAFVNEPAHYLPVLQWLAYPWLQHLGVTLMLFAFGGVLIAQYQMRDSWRIGIDTETKTKLVTTGLFRFSRNPVFTGMLLSLAGLLLAKPDVATLFFLLTGYLLIQVQVRLEEAFLVKEHGIVYQQYQLKTRRFL